MLPTSKRAMKRVKSKKLMAKNAPHGKRIIFDDDGNVSN
jgi:hypothetical protein